MTLWTEVLSEHQSNVGFVEGRNNDNPWGPEQGVYNQSYCDSAACIVPYHHGIRWPAESQFGEKGSAYCPYDVNVALGRGWFQYDHTSRNNPCDLLPADKVYFDWNGTGVADHVETVVAVYDDGTFDTIGYNALSVDAKVLTPTGWRRNGDLRVGDEVIDPVTGGPTAVVGVYSKGCRPVFTVRCADGASVRADADHLWLVHKKSTNGPASILTTSQLGAWINGGVGHGGRNRISTKKRRAFLPRLVAPEFTVTDDLPLDPWLLGYLIGDANLRRHSVRFSSVDEWLVEAASSLVPQGCSVGGDTETREGYSPSFAITGFGPGRQNPLVAVLRSLGLAGILGPNKFVPEAYKWATSKDRLAVLQGLMDSDGSIDKTESARLDFSTSSHQLALDVQHLVRSLGGKSVVYPVHSTCQRDDCRGHDSYKQRLVLPHGVNPFRLPRKADLVRRRKKFTGWMIESVEAAGEEDVSCFKVASLSGLFITDDFIVTHNTGRPEGCHLVRRDRRYLLGRYRMQGTLYADPVPTQIPMPTTLTPTPQEDEMPLFIIRNKTTGEERMVTPLGTWHIVDAVKELPDLQFAILRTTNVVDVDDGDDWNAWMKMPNFDGFVHP